ncbi:hypothetical protein F4801DRAFT_369959 [Xylaria longipes]|nr:hypothetical protein F4801DRAFT_369959 [Xylaria longipes]
MSRRFVYTCIIARSTLLVAGRLVVECSRGPLYTSRPSYSRPRCNPVKSSGRHVSQYFWSAPFFPGAGPFPESVAFSETIPGAWTIRWQKRAATRSDVALSKATPTRRSVSNSSDRGIGLDSLPSCR